MEPVWFRRGVASLAYAIPWPALRTFKTAVDTMHPVYARIFREKKAAFEEGGIEALANSASGGHDLTTLLSEFSKLLPSLDQNEIKIVQANAEADEEDRMSDENVIANMRFV